MIANRSRRPAGKTALLFLWLATSLANAQTNDNSKWRPPLGELSPSFWETHGSQVIAGIVAGILLAICVVLLLLRPKKIAPEPWELAARRELKQLAKLPENNTVLVEVSRIFKHSLLQEYRLPVNELTTVEFQTALKKTLMFPDLREISIDFLRQCDCAKFSPPPGSPVNAATYALEILEKIIARRPVVTLPATENAGMK